MNIAFVGKFEKLHDEEYIARSFEDLGHTVVRIPVTSTPTEIREAILNTVPEILLYTKWSWPHELDGFLEENRKQGLKTVCWIFDLYFGYHREHLLKSAKYFKSDYVFTTDGGHDKEFKELGINHQIVRQGIYKPECYLEPLDHPKGAVFIGSDNPYFESRRLVIGEVMKYVNDFTWYGRGDTDEVRDTDLNRLYAKTKMVIGDSFPSPFYWSNRVVETLGRGGCLVHHEVEGLKDEYPHLLTYKEGNIVELKNILTYYLKHEDERQDKVKKNFEWVRDHYTMDKKCAELLSKL